MTFLGSLLEHFSSAESQRFNLPSLKRSQFFFFAKLGGFYQALPTADIEQRAKDQTLELCACRFVTQGSCLLEGSDL